jgi:hypothetical protein
MTPIAQELQKHLPELYPNYPWQSIEPIVANLVANH